MDQYSSTGSYTAPVVPPPTHQQARLPHHASMSSSASSHGAGQYSMPSSNPYGYSSQQQSPPTQQHSRPRAGTDIVPPAIARIANMGSDLSGIGRHLTPVLNRDDAIKEWERRQSGKHSHNPYQPLEYLQQQAELLPTWNTASRGYITPSSGPYHTQSGQSGASLESGTRPGLRDVMSSVRSAANAGAEAYNTTPTTRYPPPSTYQQQQQAPTPTGYDSFEQRAPSADMASMYVPLQPSQAPMPLSQTRQLPRPAIAAPPASSPSGNQFYGASAVPVGLATGPVQQQQQQQQRGLYGIPTGASPIMGPGQSALNGDGRGMNGMDVWQR
jgi:dual specificity protein kinase YAK1